MSIFQKIGFILGILVFIFILFLIELDPQKPNLTQMAAITALMAAWWITEAIPLAATSLIPLVLFPIFGILDGEKTSSSYINSVIFLFLGGFLIALAMEKWGLHKRIALKIITLIGGTPNSIVLGFIFSSALISMWISNTATAIMMLPIGFAIIGKMENEFGKELTHNFSISVMIAIAYGCSLGGISTLIGTPTNLAFVKILKIIFPSAPPIGFGTWMLLAFPISIVMLLLAAFLLTKVFYQSDKRLMIDKTFIRNEYKSLGKITYEESVVAIVFFTTAMLWIFRVDMNLGFAVIPGWGNLFPNAKYLNDGTIAVGMALILFIIPSKNFQDQKRTILDTTIFNKVPWGIILLFGGGFALAEGFTSTGLSEFIGLRMQSLTNFSQIFIVLSVAFIVTFLTELTSNTALAQMILPIMASVSVAVQLNPLLLMITAALSASMAFMLPVATPPNAIIFASERIRIIDMAKVGFVMNIFGVIVISLMVYLLGTVLFKLNEFPFWANSIK